MVTSSLLDSGATLLVDEMRGVRSLALGFFVNTGSGSEPPEKQGISHFLEHLLFKRTRRRGAASIAQAMDRLGGDVDAFTTKEYTGFYVHTLDALFPQALDLLADVVLCSAFRAEDVSTERGVILDEIAEANDNPDDLAHEMFLRGFWRGHPLGAPIMGSVATVRGISLSDLRQFYRGAYAPANIIVSVAGRVRADDVRRGVERVLRRRRPGAGGPTPRAARPRARQHLVFEPRRGVEQAHLCLGMEAPAQTSSRRFAAHLVDTVLGGGMSSRLFQQVREKRGLAYSITSSLCAYRLGGYETVAAACAPKNLERVLDVTLSEMRKLRRGGVKGRELKQAKDNLKGGIVLSLESTVSRMSAQARQQYYFGRVEPAEELLARVEAVTAEEAAEEAGRLLGGGALSLSVVGNVARLPIGAADLAAAL
ncbi:MAG: M16 family metallopeptidase [Thermoanaerobaculia bacterium]